MKIHSLAKLGCSCKLLIVSRCHSLVQGEEMEEGKESAQIQVDDGVPGCFRTGNESCGARCLALTPCQGLAEAGFTHPVFAALNVAEGSWICAFLTAISHLFFDSSERALSHQLCFLPPVFPLAV